MGTKKCPHCQTEIDSKATKCPQCHSDLRAWPIRHPIWSAIIILFVIGVIISVASSQSPNKSVPAKSDTSGSTTSTSTPTTTVQTTPQVLLDVAGSGTKTTQKFTAASDWDLNWSYDCTSFGSQGNFQVTVYNGDGTVSYENGLVNQLGSKDSNIEHYHKGGTFYLSVNSECSWHITAKG